MQASREAMKQSESSRKLPFCFVWFAAVLGGHTEGTTWVFMVGVWFALLRVFSRWVEVKSGAAGPLTIPRKHPGVAGSYETSRAARSYCLINGYGVTIA